jgi:trimeric autotransporter adhesin
MPNMPFARAARGLLLLLGLACIDAGCGVFGAAEEMTDPEDAGVSDAHPPVTSDAGEGEAGREPLVLDTFSRTVTNGFGAADVGGVWATNPSAGAAIGVSEGTGDILLAPAAAANAFMNGVDELDVDQQVVLTESFADAGTSALYASLVSRRAEKAYACSATISAAGSVNLRVVVRVTGGEEEGAPLESASAITGFVPNEPLRLRFLTTGTSPTRLRCRVWRGAEVEPLAWQLDATDSTAELQKVGAIGMRFRLSSRATVADVTVRVDDYVARPTSPLP